ncbi:MAG: hypothetical protein MJH11_19960, partial [Lentisphaeria bacterium]|nr:hypothetical protein [Lentisphaeria bacterium]
NVDISGLQEMGNNYFSWGSLMIIFLGALMAIFSGASEIPRDISTMMISCILSKELSRHDYILGKFLGILAICFSYCFMWLTFFLIFRAFLSTAEIDLQFIIHQYLALFILIPICSCSVFFSCLFGDVVAMIFSSFYIFAGFANSFTPYIMDVNSELSVIVNVIYYIIPNFSYFIGGSASFIDIMSLIVYSLSMGLLFLFSSQSIFKYGDIY